ncbi:hypothetical protein [Helcococcus kunzii]|uniref:hypothetical protein n=1 Tax=Helcococcus kunzii TaxID=40091 RepID=UPI0024ADB7E9|nr:hypothetical protein [Helcococcus kunzii]
MDIFIEYKNVTIPKYLKIDSDKETYIFEELKSKNHFKIDEIDIFSVEILPYYEKNMLNKIIYYLNFILIFLTGISDENIFEGIKSTQIKFINLETVDKIEIKIIIDIYISEGVQYICNEYVKKEHFIPFFVLFCMPIFLLLGYIFVNTLYVKSNYILKYTLLTFIGALFSVVFLKFLS